MPAQRGARGGGGQRNTQPPSDTVEATKAFDNLYFVGLRSVAAWAVTTSEGIILIDALNNSNDAKNTIVPGLKSLGLDPNQIKYVVITHSHGDHYGGAQYLVDNFHPRVVMSDADWKGVEGPLQFNNPNWSAPPKRDITINDGDKLTLGLANGPQKLAFKGARSGAGFVGTLKVNLPPEKSVRTNFFVPDPFKPPAPASGPVTLKGQTLLVGNALPLPGLGVTVSAKTDSNGNGSIADETPVLSATGPDGKYELQITVVSGRQVFLEFSLTQFGTAMKVLSSVMPGSTIVTDVTLKELGSMAPKSGVAASSDGRLKVSNLPPQVTGVMGRVFDPTTETDQFRGEFQDAGGRFLISSVFAVVEATDNHGNRVEDLGQESLLRMDVSRNSWGTLRDLVAGNGQIDVPFFSFDESSLEWKQSASNGWLEDSQGKLIPEESLSSIRDGSYSGAVFAVGRISHLSYWNVDWPVETHACVQGQELDQEGKPVSGAKVEVDGVSYSGSSSTVTGSDGTFCVEVFRSEEPGEDLDGDGVPGESQEIRILVVSSDGNFYSFGPFGTAIGQGTCQTGGCRQLPSFTLSPEHQLQLKLCTITGTVVYSGKATGGAPQLLNKGDPVAGIPVFGIDLAAEEALVGCQSSGSCNVFTTSGPDGKFTLTVPVLTGVQLVATGLKTSGTLSGFDTYTGLLSLSQCPESPVTLEVDFHRVVSLVAALLDENQGPVGNLTVSTEVAICFILINGEAFFGVDESVSSDIPPNQLGPWLQMDLFKSSTQAGDKAGTVLFSAGSLDSPISGTWEAKDTSGSVLLGGTWSEGGR